MKFRIFATLLLAFTLGCSRKAPETKTLVPQAPVGTQPSIEQQHSTTHRIGVYEQFEGQIMKHHGEVGHCSGTSVGPHAILTALHCMKDSNLIRIDDDSSPVKIMAALIDGNDHVIYIVKYDFKTWAEIDQRTLVAKEPAHFWGAPGDNTDVYRVGYFEKLAAEPDLDENFLLQKFVLPTYRGDSGSGIFDENGRVVAVITFANESANEMSEPLEFTDGQLDVAVSE